MIYYHTFSGAVCTPSIQSHTILHLAPCKSFWKWHFWNRSWWFEVISWTQNHSFSYVNSCWLYAVRSGGFFLWKTTELVLLVTQFFHVFPWYGIFLLGLLQEFLKLLHVALTFIKYYQRVLQFFSCPGYPLQPRVWNLLEIYCPRVFNCIPRSKLR